MSYLTMEQSNESLINNDTVELLTQACLTADQIETERVAVLQDIYAEHARAIKYAQETNTLPVVDIRLLSSGSFDVTKFGPDLSMIGWTLSNDEIEKVIKHFESTGKTMALVQQHKTKTGGTVDVYFVSQNDKYYTINLTDGKLTYAMETQFI